MNKVAITWTNRWCNEPWLWQRGRQDCQKSNLPTIQAFVCYSFASEWL
jgi:hypothetical protein